MTATKETRGEKAHRLAVAAVLRAARRLERFWRAERESHDLIHAVRRAAHEERRARLELGDERRAATRKAKR